MVQIEDRTENRETRVVGMDGAMKMAEAGMQLFKKEVQIEYNVEFAATFKACQEAKIKALEEEAGVLHGKDNMKARAAKGKAAAALRAEPQYIDACKVIKGLDAPNGFFVKSSGAPLEEKPKGENPLAEHPVQDDKKEEKKKEEKKQKTMESAGLGPAEVKELETLKNDIIARKGQLKVEGMSGGQQNKDPQVVQWVKRMNDLKEKQDPGCTQKDKKDDKKKPKAAVGSEMQKECDALKVEIEVYRARLRTEFGYTNKDIKADPELAEMDAKLKDFQKRGAY
jgi:hypothetical protein